jgi:hypothetical protein
MGFRTFLSFALLGASLAGCQPKIGDACELATDCSATGARLCDRSMPGGYCTLFNCEPGSCPEDEGVCVAFDPELDPACGPLDDAQPARFLRTFCMAPCGSGDDCREGYACLEPSVQGAKIVDPSPVSRRVCLRASSVGPSSSNGGSDGESAEPPGICSMGTASAEDLPDPSGSSGQGGSAGAGGSGGGGG